MYDLPILVNRAKCLKCGDVVISGYGHDFRWCKCGSIAVDGGRNYLKRAAKNFDDIEEQSVYAITTKELEDIIKYRLEQAKVLARVRSRINTLVGCIRQALQKMRLS